MNTSKLLPTLLLSLAAASASATDAFAQLPLGPTIYGFGDGARGPEGMPRTLDLDNANQGGSATVYYSMGKPKSQLIVTFATQPLYTPVPLAGGQIFLDPRFLIATMPCTTDANGGALVPLGKIPTTPSYYGLTLYGQAFEVQGSSLFQSTAFAAQAAKGCTVRAQATGLVFGSPGEAVFRSISVTNGCTYKVIAQYVAAPAAGVTIKRRKGVGNNTTVEFDHSKIAVGTNVSIMLEVHCTCGSVTSQHFLFARGTK